MYLITVNKESGQVEKDEAYLQKIFSIYFKQRTDLRYFSATPNAESKISIPNFSNDNKF